MRDLATSRVRGRRARPGGWRKGEAKRLDHDSVVRDYFMLGLVGMLFRGGYDRLQRREAPRWALAFLGFVVGILWLVSAVSRRTPFDPFHMGWMTWGCAGAVLFVGCWLASMPYAGTRTGTALRWTAIALAAGPILAHSFGWL